MIQELYKLKEQVVIIKKKDCKYLYKVKLLQRGISL